MGNPLIRRLASFSDLGADDCATLELLCRSPGRGHVEGALVGEKGRPEAAVCFLEGWGYRYIVTAEGRCQIVALLLPSDICEPYGYLLGTTDYPLGVQGRAEIVIVPGPTIAGLTKRHPAIVQALLRSTLVDGAILRQWLVNVGQRDARQRLAHLFCELWYRLNQVGHADEGGFECPLTQEQLGGILALTAIHVNRTLKQLRTEGLISFQQKRVGLPDRKRLEQVAGFDPRYLHLAR